jgi:hypothetical protein
VIPTSIIWSYFFTRARTDAFTVGSDSLKPAPARVCELRMAACATQTFNLLEDAGHQSKNG